MVLIYISGGKERMRTQFGARTYSKKEMAAAMKMYGILVAKSASQKIDFIVLPPGVDKASATTHAKTMNAKTGQSKPVLKWSEFARKFLKGRVKQVQRDVAIVQSARKGGGSALVGARTVRLL